MEAKKRLVSGNSHAGKLVEYFLVSAAASGPKLLLAASRLASSASSDGGMGSRLASVTHGESISPSRAHFALRQAPGVRPRGIVEATDLHYRDGRWWGRE